MSEAFPETQVRSLPKAELHVHLEGSVGAETLLALAAEHGVEPPAPDVASVRRWYDFRDFDDFLERYFFVCRLLKRRQDFQRIAYDYLLSAHATLDAVLAQLHPRVVALGMGGPSEPWWTEDFAPTFDRARAAGLRAVCHAGEHGPAREVSHAVERFGAERIQHGIGAMDDREVVELLLERAIPCDVCPGSNIALKAVADFASHPLPQMIEAGITVTLGSDDPPLFHTDLLNEYRIAWEHSGLRQDALEELARNSIRESFAADGDKARWQAGFS